MGDTLFPAQSLAAGFAQDLDPAANIFLRLRILHPMIACVRGGVADLLRGDWPRRARQRRGGIAWGLGVLLAAQIAAGVMNLVLLAPVWLQMAHLLIADLLWITLVLLCASVLAPAPSRA